MHGDETIQPFTTKLRLIATLKEKDFEDSVGKGENTGNHYFLLSRNVFYLTTKGNFHMSNITFATCKFYEVAPV